MALGDNNPAGSSTPAGNTMSVPRGQSGGRTRNVVSVVQPGSSGNTAYTFTATSNTPTAATDGFPNFRRQRYLHVHLSGSVSQGGDGAQILLWGYNSFAEQWGALQLKDPTSDVGFANAQLTASHESPRKYYIFDINGAERIAAECTDAVVNGDTKFYLYLGVNTF